MMKNKSAVTVCTIVSTFLILASCTGGVKDKDGNRYKTVKIGNQEWMSENLTVSRFRNGDAIPEAISAEEWEMLGREGKPAWCIQQNDPESAKKYGRLYNWFAVNDPRGLAPSGWHIPSDDEWKQLTDNLGGEVSAALQMRTTGLTGNVKGTHEIGFLALPAGARKNDGSFFGLGSHSIWWSSTEVTASTAWTRMLNYIYCNLYSLNYNKISGFSVRCIRD